ncbi:acyltransferase [Methyloceanibacter stevinii]|uniref:Acyltransferase n=1 Tax=Methyloceanibacter stevinii TaxID=1774970 RepID=A0A1E3VRM3_9HYPH|nr:acyltransferase [Methyloceanibacter stevinii]
MATGSDRIAWVDYAKGICIIMVVMMHSTLGVQEATGEPSWMGALVAFAKPFRMPDFFLISGLFLARVIDRPWRRYLDTKVVHFAYFYVLWVTIQFVVKSHHFIEDGLAGALEAYALAYIQPFSTLWFIYLLPIFFVVSKLTRGVSPLIVWPLAAALQIAGVDTGSIVIDEFCARFVYFYSGYVFAAFFFRFADTVQQHPREAAALLLAWAVFEALMVFGGVSELPVVNLGLGFLGALAVISSGVLLWRLDLADFVRYAGENSIVIYLAFFLPMAATRILLLKFAPGLDTGLVSLIVTAMGVVTPLILHRVVRDTAFSFLFKRPDWAKLDPTPVSPPAKAS